MSKSMHVILVYPWYVMVCCKNRQWPTVVFYVLFCLIDKHKFQISVHFIPRKIPEYPLKTLRYHSKTLLQQFALAMHFCAGIYTDIVSNYHPISKSHMFLCTHVSKTEQIDVWHFQFSILTTNWNNFIVNYSPWTEAHLMQKGKDKWFAATWYDWREVKVK